MTDRRRFKLVSAVHLFLVRDGRVLLLRRRNTGYEDGSYSVVAGHLDGDEEVVEAAAREALEEIGVVIAAADVRVVGVMHRRGEVGGVGDERINFFLSTACWIGEVVNSEPEKCDDLLWADPLHLPANVVPYVRRAIANGRQGLWFDSFGWPR
jgi:8-oxo-dGTP pyrophosphatase MutT (NUDIX family)